MVNRRAEELGNLLWVIGINVTPHPFYTSDHPVVRRANTFSGPVPMVGIHDKGIEFIFPLSSRHVLLILERSHFASWRKHDTKAIPLTAEQIEGYNQVQVMRSSQRLYCQKDAFDLARKVCGEHPEICDPNRRRVRVDMTPIENMTSTLVVTALE
jgi:hypothetical protein